MEALRHLRAGDLDELAELYADDAVLDMSVPGGRRRLVGVVAVQRELRDGWRAGVPADPFEADEHLGGAAVSLVRDGLRQRHYLRVGGDGRITRHWVYAAGVVAPDDSVLPAAVLERLGARRVPAAFAGNSGAAVERLALPDGTLLVAKRVVPGADWLSRAMGGGARSADLFEEGVLGRLPPAIDHATVAVEPDGDGRWLLMRDVSDALLGDDRRLSREESRFILGAAAEMHRAFAGEAIPALAPLHARLGFTSPAVAASERDAHDLLPKQFEAAWEAFADVVPADVAEPVLALRSDPSSLVARLQRGASTLLHADLRDDNLGLAGDRLVLLDWDIATHGPPAVELAWYMCHDRWRIDATHDEIVADFRAAEGELVEDADLELGLVSGLVMYGWILGHSAIVHPAPAERRWAREELGWWVPRVRAALERYW